MGRKITEQITEQVFVLYEQMNSMQKVADALKIGKGTVHKILKDYEQSDRHEQLLNDYKKAREESNEKLLDIMQSEAVDKVVKLAIGKLNDENITRDIAKYGIGNMYRLIGMFTDKTLSIKEHDIKLKQLAIKERELSIKEKELELRISNPEAFHEVHIINDAPKEERDAPSPN